MIYKLQILYTIISLVLIYIFVHVLNEFITMMMTIGIGGTAFIMLGPTREDMSIENFAILGVTAIPMLFGGVFFGLWCVTMGISYFSILLFPLGVVFFFSGLGILWGSLNFSLFPFMMSYKFAKKNNLNVLTIIIALIFQYTALFFMIYYHFYKYLYL
jgi:hypothetical protein